MKARHLILIEVSMIAMGKDQEDLNANIESVRQDLWFALRHQSYTVEASVTEEIK